MSKHPNFLTDENIAIAKNLLVNNMDYHDIDGVYLMVVAWDNTVWVIEMGDTCSLLDGIMVQRII